MQSSTLLIAVAMPLAFHSLVACSSSSGGVSGPVDSGTSDGAASDTGGGSDSSVMDSAADAPDLAVSCENYCSLVVLNCTGQNNEYIAKETCLSMCAHMTVGTKPDMMNDTVACRQYHAGAAASLPTLHCPHAGPTGNDTCGPSRCAAWCALDLALCGTTAYADQTTCEADCAGYTYSATSGDIAATSGNTLNCRIYHLEAAYANGGALKSTHCPHTAKVSAVCQ